MGNVMTRKKTVAAETETSIIAYKAFDRNLQCRGFQYEVGKTYEHNGTVSLCDRGFHSCENPLDVLSYYDICDGIRFAQVKASGQIDRRSDGDTKIASAIIHIEAELTLPDFIKRAIQWVADACKADDKVSGHSATNASSGDYAKNEATGKHSVIAAAGRGSLAKGAVGVWISLAEYAELDGEYRCVGFATGQAGHDGVPADVWLKASGGKLVEA